MHDVNISYWYYVWVFVLLNGFGVNSCGRMFIGWNIRKKEIVCMCIYNSCAHIHTPRVTVFFFCYSCSLFSFFLSRFQVVASVIMKLCGGSGDKSAYKEELNVDSFLSQVCLLTPMHTVHIPYSWGKQSINQAEVLEKERKATLAGRLYDTVSSGVATHPAPLLRATEIKNWSQSAEYAGLLARAISPRA